MSHPSDTQTKILLNSGSLRAGSTNSSVLRTAATLAFVNALVRHVETRVRPPTWC